MRRALERHVEGLLGSLKVFLGHGELTLLVGARKHMLHMVMAKTMFYITLY